MRSNDGGGGSRGARWLRMFNTRRTPRIVTALREAESAPAIPPPRFRARAAGAVPFEAGTRFVWRQFEPAMRWPPSFKGRDGFGPGAMKRSLSRVCCETIVRQVVETDGPSHEALDRESFSGLADEAAKFAVAGNLGLPTTPPHRGLSRRVQGAARSSRAAATSGLAGDGPILVSVAGYDRFDNWAALSSDEKDRRAVARRLQAALDRDGFAAVASLPRGTRPRPFRRSPRRDRIYLASSFAESASPAR